MAKLLKVRIIFFQLKKYVELPKMIVTSLQYVKTLILGNMNVLANQVTLAMEKHVQV